MATKMEDQNLGIKADHGLMQVKRIAMLQENIIQYF